MDTTSKLQDKLGVIAAAKAGDVPAKVTAKEQGLKEISKSSNPIKQFLGSEKFQNQLKLALPKFLPPELLTRVVLTECTKNPELLECTQDSFFGAVLQCAQLGLIPGGALGQCYLIPFGRYNSKLKRDVKEVQLVLGYRGMLGLARRSGEIESISAYCVHEKDQFHYELGLHEDIRHIPFRLGDPGKVTFTYAVAKIKGGGYQFEVMRRSVVEAIRNRSSGYMSYLSLKEKYPNTKKTNPWDTDFEAMAKKTVIRRLFKYLPVSVDAAQAISIDEGSDRGEVVSYEDLEAQYESKGVSDLPPDIPTAAPQQPAPDGWNDGPWQA